MRVKSPDPFRISMKSTRLQSLVILGVVCLYVWIHSPSFFAGPLDLDDMDELAFINKIKLPWAVFGSDVFSLFRPVKNICFLLFSLFQPHNFVWARISALAVGVVAFVLVFQLMRYILGDGKQALLGASIWMLSPTMVSCTTWLSCVNIHLMVCFSVLALSLHAQSYERSPVQMSMGAGLCLFLALISYESAIAVGPAVILCDYCLFPDRVRRRDSLGRYAVYAFFSVVYLAFRHFVNGATELNGNFDETTRLQMCFSSAWFTIEHLHSWFWPFGRMAALGGYVWGDIPIWKIGASWLFLSLFVAWAFLFRKRHPVFCFGVLFFFLTFLPTSNILGFGNGPYGDYYLALPSVGICLAIIDGGNMLLHSRIGRRLAVSVCALFVVVRVAACYESRTWDYLWSDMELAARAGLITFPNSFSNQMILASRLCNRGELTEASELLDRVKQRHDPESKVLWEAPIIETVLELQRGDAEAALKAIDSLNPEYPTGRKLYHGYRGMVFEDGFGDVSSAMSEYETCLATKPWDVDLIPFISRLGRLYAIQGELDRAISIWEDALMLAPDDAVLRQNLAVAYVEREKIGAPIPVAK